MPQKTSILTPDQRDWLRGERDDIEPGGASERMMKSRIRTRLRMGIVDCYLILRRLDPEDIQTALQVDRDDFILFDNGVKAAMGILFLSFLKRGEGRDQPELWRFAEDSFEERAKQGIRMALNQLGENVERVNVTVEIERGEDFGELDMDKLGQYSSDTLFQALNAGVITEEQFADAIKARQ